MLVCRVAVREAAGSLAEQVFGGGLQVAAVVVAAPLGELAVPLRRALLPAVGQRGGGQVDPVGGGSLL